MEFINKNVLLVFAGGNLGGAERQGLGLAKFLTNKKGCKVDILFISSNKLSEEFEFFLKKSCINKSFYFGEPYIVLRKEISIKNLKRLKWSVQYLLKLRKGLINEKYDIVIPFQNTPSKIAYYLYKLLPTVKYTFWHQLGLDVLKYDIFENIAVKYMPCFIGNAENCLEVFNSDYIVNKKKLNLLPQYVSLKKESRNKNLIKNKFNISENCIVFGMIAHFKSFKYHALTLRVFKKINLKYPNTHLILMGNKDNDEGTLDIYENLKEEINDFDKVTLLSNESVIDVLNILDIGMLLSLIEGTPNSVLEYMLYGLPVICSNHSGCNSLLENSPFLVNNEEEEIFNAMQKLLEDKDLFKKEANLNLERIKKYNINSYVDRLESIIN